MVSDDNEEDPILEYLKSLGLEGTKLAKARAFVESGHPPTEAVLMVSGAVVKDMKVDMVSRALEERDAAANLHVYVPTHVSIKNLPGASMGMVFLTRAETLGSIGTDMVFLALGLGLLSIRNRNTEYLVPFSQLLADASTLMDLFGRTTSEKLGNLLTQNLDGFLVNHKIASATPSQVAAVATKIRNKRSAILSFKELRQYLTPSGFNSKFCRDLLYHPVLFRIQKGTAHVSISTEVANQIRDSPRHPEKNRNTTLFDILKPSNNAGFVKADYEEIAQGLVGSTWGLLFDDVAGKERITGSTIDPRKLDATQRRREKYFQGINTLQQFNIASIKATRAIINSIPKRRDLFDIYFSIL